MNIKEIEAFSPGMFFADFRDTSNYYVTKRMMDAYDKGANIRKKIQTVEDFQVYSKNAKKVFLDSVGEIPYDREYPLHAKVTGEIKETELTIEKVIFEAREGVYVTVNLYLPHNREERCPAVLLQCGHSENGKAYPAYQRAARIIAKTGIIVLVMDPPGQGERLSYLEEGSDVPLVPGAVPHHQRFGNQCFLVGASPVKYFLADAMRAIDYLCSREEVDSGRIGATGISGGGTLTSALMAIDDRICAAAPGCWPTSGKEYFFVGMSPDSEQVWPDTVKEGFDHYEVMAAMCPKPLMLLAAEEDFIPIEGTEKLFGECKRFWTLHGCADKVELTIGKGSHGYSAELAMAAAMFFQRHLCGVEKELPVIDSTTLPDETLNCTKSGQIKKEFVDSVFVFDENLKEYRNSKTAKLSREERHKWFYEHVYGGREVVDPLHVRRFEMMRPEELCEEQICAVPLMWYSQSLMPCYGVLFQNDASTDRPVTICLWQGGTDNISGNLDEIKKICRGGRSALVLDLTAMGKCSPYAPLGLYNPSESIMGVIDRLAKHLFTLGDSLCAVKAFDLLQSVKMLKENMGVHDIEVFAIDKYSIFARIAQVLDAELKIELKDEVSVSELITNEYYDIYDVAHVMMPGLGKYLD